MAKSSLHSVHQVGKIKAEKRKVNGIPTLFIQEDELRRYAQKKAERLYKQLAKMDGRFLK
jgi:hypothetical protein